MHQVVPIANIRRMKGFTLIEIMVVVVILGILAALVAPQVIEQIDKANRVKAETDIRAIDQALTMYRINHFKYPTTDQGLQALVTQPADPTIKNYPREGYLKLKPDPWGNPYQYQSPGTNGEYDVFTYGADGQPGGEGPASDIGNWELDQ